METRASRRLGGSMRAAGRSRTGARLCRGEHGGMAYPRGVAEGEGCRMKALTVYAPWAHLIMIGAKPYEFRRWDYRTRERALEGQRIVIHASARPIRLVEIEDIIARMEDRISSLHASIAM